MSTVHGSCLRGILRIRELSLSVISETGLFIRKEMVKRGLWDIFSFIEYVES